MIDMPATTLYDGLPITIGGIDCVLPSMSAKTARKHWDRIQSMQTPEALALPDRLDLTIALVTECLQRNHPDIALAVVEDYVDVANYDELSAMCFGRGAWLRWVEMQAAMSGNVIAPRVLAPTTVVGTGVPSTPASPPLQAGDPATSMS